MTKLWGFKAYWILKANVRSEIDSNLDKSCCKSQVQNHLFYYCTSTFDAVLLYNISIHLFVPKITLVIGIEWSHEKEASTSAEQRFATIFLRPERGEEAMPRAIANGLHYLNWNHNVDVSLFMCQSTSDRKARTYITTALLINIQFHIQYPVHIEVMSKLTNFFKPRLHDVKHSKIRKPLAF